MQYPTIPHTDFRERKEKLDHSELMNIHQLYGIVISSTSSSKHFTKIL